MQQRELLDPLPTISSDGSIDAVVQSVRPVGPYRVLQMAMPATSSQNSFAGRYILARCVPTEAGAMRNDWSVYLRRPLFIIASRPVPGNSDAVSVSLLLPDADDPGYEFLSDQIPGNVVNVLGPFGRNSAPPEAARHLLLVASSATAPILLPAAEEMLDRGGRVSVIVRDTHVNKGMLALFPLAIEIHAAWQDDDWYSLLADAITWADSMMVADSSLSPQMWADTIRKRRLTLDESFAQILMPSDLLCATGACMACVVPRANGSHTRACIHGPIFPLTSLMD